MNSVCLIGNLTRDPELRYGTGQNQTAICRFSIAVNDGFGEKKEVNYINIVSFGKVAENCERYLAKGRKVGVTGRIKTGSYTSQKTGEKVYTTDIVANNVEFLSGQEQQQPPQGMSFTPAQGFGQPQGFGQQPQYAPVQQTVTTPQQAPQQFGNFAQSPMPQQAPQAQPQQEPQQMQGFTALTDEEIPF